jgi:sugar lactone lactonase YvrE
MVTEFTRDVNVPSGLAFGPDGTLYVAEYGSGEISSVSASGQVTALVTGLTRPQSVAADDAGNLYVSAYDPSGAQPEENGNSIWKVAPNGSRTLYASTGAADLAFIPDGDLLVSRSVAGGSGIMRVAADGSVTPFASGFLGAVGLAFDLSGDLYVSDDWHNSITRISGFPQGTLQGTVRDAGTGQPIPAARLSIVSGYPLVLGGTVNADSGGTYQVAIAPRSYSVTASAPGYESSTQMTSVQADGTVSLNFELAPGNRLYLPLVLRTGTPGF